MQTRDTKQKFGKSAREPFTVGMAERAARAYKKEHGKAPSTRAGTERLPDGWTWSAVDHKLRKSGGGLPKFLIAKGIADVKEEFSEKMVERCARAYKGKHGKPPSQLSGGECLPSGWTWNAIDHRLEGGLPRFLAESGIRDPGFNETAVKYLRAGSDPEFIRKVLVGWLSAESGVPEADCLAVVGAGLRRIVMALKGSAGRAGSQKPAAAHSPEALWNEIDDVARFAQKSRRGV